MLEPIGTDQPVRVLSLAGGGFLGLYTAVVLEGLEARVGMPLGRRFDLIAGTSIGGLLALALAYEVPMSRLVRLFVDHGPEVFSNRALPAGAVSRTRFSFPSRTPSGSERPPGAAEAGSVAEAMEKIGRAHV